MERKVALVTGGSRGLGKSIAMHLAARGSDVLVTYLSKEVEAREVVRAIEQQGGKAAALMLDTSAIASFGTFADSLRVLLRETWGRETFDHLINNAGIGVRSSFMETSEELFDRLMNIHFKGVFFLTQRLLPMISDGGRILNVSSGLARFSQPGFAAYAAMKGAIETLTRYQAREFAARKITVNAIAPGAIATDFGGGQVRDNPEVHRTVATGTALGRVGVADDIGSAVSAILSDEMHWMTGQRIEVSGGMFL